MARTHYRNGEEITLDCGCDDCNPSMINGILCHEIGCRSAWKDNEVECFECGYEFVPESRGERICPDCWDAIANLPADDDSDDD